MSFMRCRFCWSLFVAHLVLTAAGSIAAGPASGDPSVTALRGRIERTLADLAALERSHAVPLSEKRRERLERFLADELRELEALDFDALDCDGRIDYLLLRSRLRFQERGLARERRRAGEVERLLPFAPGIVELEEARRRLDPIDPRRSAEALDGLAAKLAALRQELEAEIKTGKEPSAIIGRPAARRAAAMTDSLRATLKRWHDFYAGYDPELTWWASRPYQELDKALEGHAGFIRKRLAGFSDGEDEPVIGDPIGREALREALEHEMIPYSPEELIAIAEREFAWCDAEMLRAARDLGFGEDWRRALEHVKEQHVKPGEQPKLIQELAEEAVRFLEERRLVTLPDLAKEVWRLEMMSPERQKVNPYFTGGEVISVSYPTSSMSHEDKVMSLRGNNVAFCRATVHHELIPGHHLQGFMASRYRTHRRAFRTPFLVEGWPLYWEMLLWDLEFPRTPEHRIGMLFWRSHRCARIIFSLRFHLEEMTAAEAIDFLVERVGHERRNATAEVRRSVSGDYPPLYQAAYMVGGLQLRALRRELVGTGKMSDRDFHDAVLRENAIPIELIRASLTGADIRRDHAPSWRFDDAFTAAEGPGPREATRVGQRRTASAGRRTGALERPPVRTRVEPRWYAGNDRFWYRNDLGAGRREFIVVDALAGRRAPAFDHERLARAWREQLGEAAQADRPPFDSIEPPDDGRSIRLIGAQRIRRLDLEDYRLTDEGEAPPRAEAREPPAPRFGRRRPEPQAGGARSPDGRFEVLLRGDNLFLRDSRMETLRQLSHDASPANSYARLRQRERAVELDYERPDPEPPEPEVYWAPDSRRFVAMRTRQGNERRVYLIESSPRDQLQPKLHSYPYLKPGDEIPVRKPRLFEAETCREIPLDDALFPNPWSIDPPRWSADGARFTFLYNQRGHQLLRLVGVDAMSGEARAIIDERSDTFIDYAGKRFIEHLEESAEIIWMSERDGWNHLYLYDARTGEVKNQITRGEWVVRGVERVDREGRQVWFRAGGLRPGEDPYHVHYCRIGFDGAGFVILTEGDANHSIELSPDRRFFIDTWSRVDLPPVIELRRSADGKLVVELERNDPAELEAAGWRPPERFAAKGRDGATEIHGIIHRPADFDPQRKYPVIESIYAGPHGSHVPKSFRAEYRQQEIADAGFVVVQIDGMGTSNRSKRFHDVCWKNIGDAGFPDRILWMEAAAAERPWMDLTRVGIYGGSAGGQNAVRALIAHGDFYKAAAADCGCHDNRMDKIWWNELWMGWPVGPHYDEQSNVTQAHRLRGHLLLTVGELDRNVDPSSTMQLAAALIRAGKDFELIVVPGAGHGAGESEYCRRRRREFFQRHLQGPAPPSAVAASGEMERRRY
jgi:dipeptidyl-peptidase-4